LLDEAPPEDTQVSRSSCIEPSPAQEEDTRRALRTWDVITGHPIAQKLDTATQLARLCEYVDLHEYLEGMSLAEFLGASFASDAAKTDEVEPEAANDTTEPSDHGDGDSPEIKRPACMLGVRVVYRFPGQNVLSDANGVTSDETPAFTHFGRVTSDSERTVSFTDVDGVAWPNVVRTKVFPIADDAYLEIHVLPREAKEIEGWLAGNPAKGQPEGTLLRSLFYEFTEHPDRIAFAIMNGKKPYVDRFVSLPEHGFEDDQKPTRRLFGEHCFRVRGKDYVVKVVTP
jgi:hypothetical protein